MYVWGFYPNSYIVCEISRINRMGGETGGLVHTVKIYGGWNCEWKWIIPQYALRIDIVDGVVHNTPGKYTTY